MMDHKIMVQMKIEEKTNYVGNKKEDNGGKKQTKYGTRKNTT